MCDAVAEKSTDLGAQSAQQLKIAAMSFDEQKTFAGTKENLEQNTTGIPVVMQRQVLVIQKAQRTVGHCFSTLTRPSMSQLPRHHSKQHEDCMTKYKEIKMHRKLGSACFELYKTNEQTKYLDVLFKNMLRKFGFRKC